jgi:hypothetical protein
MKSRRLIYALLIVGLIGTGFVVVVTLSTREPCYEGKPFSYWLDQIPCTMTWPNGSYSMMYPVTYRTRAEAEADQENFVKRTDKALKAVSQIGGQCLPMLVRRLRTKDSPLKTTLTRWAVRLHLIRSSWIRPADTVRGQALTAIVKLDYTAKPIFSELAVLAHDNDPAVKAAAKYALNRLNPAEFERLEKLQQTRKTP